MIRALEPLALPDELPTLPPGRKAPRIELSEEDRRFVRKRARAASSSQRDAFRARIILLADRGLDNRSIARQLGCCEDTVGTWRRRFAEHGPKGLRDLPRSGRPPRFSPEQKARVLEKATQTPRQAGVPFSHWDASALQRLAIEAGITTSIHPSTVWRWLHQADLKPHRMHFWLRSSDPDFETRMADVTQLYLATPALHRQGSAVFSVDEKTSIQALERLRPDLPMIPGICQRIEHEYIRHGTRCLTAAFNVATGRVHGLLTPDRPNTVFARFIDALCRDGAPHAPSIHLVMDQLNTHWSHELCQVIARWSDIHYDPERHPTGDDRRQFLLRDDKRVVVHYTPKHASWLNQIEIWFSVLVRKLLKRETFRSLEELERRILEFIAYHNRYLAHPYRWTYTGAPCRA